MKTGTSIALNNELQAGEDRIIYRTQCLKALDLCKQKESNLRSTESIKVSVRKIPYGYITVYKKIK